MFGLTLKCENLPVGHLREIYLRIECSLVSRKSLVRFANIVEQMCTQKPARCPLNAINGLLSAGQQCSLTRCRSVPSFDSGVHLATPLPRSAASGWAAVLWFEVLIPMMPLLLRHLAHNPFARCSSTCELFVTRLVSLELCSRPDKSSGCGCGWMWMDEDVDVDVAVDHRPQIGRCPMSTARNATSFGPAVTSVASGTRYEFVITKSVGWSVWPNAMSSEGLLEMMARIRRMLFISPL
uniref:HDC00427 n=1 Tax=Drosophila melanogaster TaxID=7227 RepID=Q6IHX5_DROME|nr:TPA_inf: HDC00427 [Drosophila melanogaster]